MDLSLGHASFGFRSICVCVFQSETLHMHTPCDQQQQLKREQLLFIHNYYEHKRRKKNKMKRKIFINCQLIKLLINVTLKKTRREN